MYESSTVNALKALLDPSAVAAWLDEVESYRTRRATHHTPVPQPSSHGEGLMTVAEVGDLLRVKSSWVYEMTRRNEIPHVRVGRYVRFRRGDIDQWLDETRPDGER